MKIEKNRLGLFSITGSLVLMAILLFGTMFYVYNGLRNLVIQNAEDSLDDVIEDIEELLSSTAIVPENVAWMLQDKIRQPDAMFSITRHVVENNEQIAGCAIAFTPDYYPAKGRYFSPYSYRNNEKTVKTIQMGNEQYDYFSMDWFTSPVESGKKSWSEPYFDTGGGEMLMTTCSVPVRDDKGEIIAVTTADISLEALSRRLSAIVPYEGAQVFMMGKDGTYISHPDPSWILKKNFMDMAAATGDDRVLLLGEKMLAGEKGKASFSWQGGERMFVVYAPLSTGWSIALICPLDIVFSLVSKINTVIWIFLILTAFLIWMIVRYIRKTAGSKMRMESELSIASGIQNEMLAKNFPKDGPVDLYAMLQPARETGGDLYDFHIKDDKVYFSIGDVSGKGVPAALFMAITRSVLRFIAGLGLNPAKIVTRINRTFCASNSTSMFVTLFVAAIDLNTWEMEFCNAGHNPIVILEPGKPARFLKAKTNIAAGLMEDFEYEGETIMLGEGASLLLYTDGVTEAENDRHEQYGEERLLDFCNKISSGMTAKEVVTELHQSVRDFADIAPQNDDITILYVKL